MPDDGSPAPLDFDKPHVELIGELTEDRAVDFIKRLQDVAEGAEPLLISVTTVGGDADLARRILLELSRLRQRSARRIAFIGKTQCYSAGVSIMSAFPVADRYLTGDCWLLIHCRQLDKTVEISGPMRSSLPQVRSLCHQIELGLEREEENFRRLIEGSEIDMADLLEKALCNWYVPAKEALELGLVAGIVAAS